MYFFRASLVLILFSASLNFSQAKETSEYRENGYTLIFINDDPTFDPHVKWRLIETFFRLYPTMAKDFNADATKTVTFSIEPGPGVAATSGTTVHFSADHLRRNPKDIDVATHEIMHLVQAYPDANPWWLTEGIADYARHKYGLDNKSAGWELPNYATGQSYTNSYAVTARFLVWLEKKTPGIVKNLDLAMRSGTYKIEIWKDQTGKSLDELWSEYAANPAIASS